MGVSEEHCEASAGREKAGALPLSATVCGRMPACGHTGAVGVPHRVRTTIQVNVMPLSRYRQSRCERSTPA
jgi:hypothetical protein